MSNKWEGTGVYVDPQEFKQIKELIESIKTAPMVTFNSDEPTLPEIGREIMFREIKKIAVKHGLPERAENYGMDINTGQILK